MKRRTVEAVDAPSASGGYAQAVEIEGASRLLFISGQIPSDADGRVPETFEKQCRLVWANIDAQLRAAGMTLDDLVKVTTYLGDRRNAGDNARIRRDVLGARTPALTVVIAGIYDESWLVEIEAIAASGPPT